LVADLNEKSAFLGIGGMEQQTVYDLAEKHDSSLDLIEKNLGENDLVLRVKY
jgi:hypothetical protein